MLIVQVHSVSLKCSSFELKKVRVGVCDKIVYRQYDQYERISIVHQIEYCVGESHGSHHDMRWQLSESLLSRSEATRGKWSWAGRKDVEPVWEEEGRDLGGRDGQK